MSLDYDVKGSTASPGGPSRLMQVFAVRELIDYAPVRPTRTRRVAALSLVFYSIAMLTLFMFVVFYNPNGAFTGLGGSDPVVIGVISDEPTSSRCRPLQTLSLSQVGLVATLFDDPQDNRVVTTGQIVLDTEKVTVEDSSCEAIVRDLLASELQALAGDPGRNIECLAGAGTCVSFQQDELIAIDGLDYLLHLAGAGPAEVAGYLLQPGLSSNFDGGTNGAGVYSTSFAGYMTQPTGGVLGTCEVGNIPTNVSDSFGDDFRFDGLKEVQVTINWPATVAAGHAVFDFVFQMKLFRIDEDLRDWTDDNRNDTGFSSSFSGNCTESFANVALSKRILDNVKLLVDTVGDDALLPTFPEERYLHDVFFQTPGDHQSEIPAILRQTSRTIFYDLPRWITGEVAADVCANFLDRVAPFECEQDLHKSTTEALGLAVGNTSIVMIFVIVILRFCRA